MVTDRLVILSGDTIMYMDPFEGEENNCKKKRVAGKKGRELTALLESVGGVFGVSRETFRAGGGGFPGTVFWFPLRQRGGALSGTVYCPDKVRALLASFRAEAPSLLLFLHHVQRVHIQARGGAGPPGDLFSVGIASSCLGRVGEQRRQFVAAIREAGTDLPEEECYCVTEVIMETVDHAPGLITRGTEESDHFPSSVLSSAQSDPAKSGGQATVCEENHGNDPATEAASDTAGRDSSRVVQRWLVISYHAGRGDVSQELSRLCADPDLCYRPYVGLAVPLTDRSAFQSQVFCFLPLPLDTRSPTGLPVHVHGYFALSQNRRHLKWPTADQLSQQALVEPPLRWNCLLVDELLPRVYGALLER